MTKLEQLEQLENEAKAFLKTLTIEQLKNILLKSAADMDDVNFHSHRMVRKELSSHISPKEFAAFSKKESKMLVKSYYDEMEKLRCKQGEMK